MPLPKLSVPEYELELPSTGEKVKYRPFLVREEKILFMAMESQDEKEMVSSVKNIIKSCTNIKRKVEELATFEIEYLFLKIRAKSVGESSTFMITCPDDGETQVEVKVDLDEVELEMNEAHSRKIMLDDNVGVLMKYPSLDTFVKLNLAAEDTPTMDNMFELAATSMDQIFDGEEVWECKSTPKKEIMEFLEGMNSEQFQKIQAFFETMPKLKKVLTVKNPKTEVESEVVLEGLAAFFA
jgi:T4 bacteriophage base plate protein